LQSQIDKLATKEELQQKAQDLSTAIEIAQQEAINAKTVADAAKKAAEAAATSGDVDAAKKAAIDAANQAVADLKKELEESLASKQDLEQAAKAAEKVVTDLQSSLVGDTGLTIDQVMAIVNEAVDKVNDDKKGLDALETRLAAVESKLTPEGSEEEIDLTEIQKELDDIEDALAEILGDVSTMVTSVELIYDDPMHWSKLTNLMTFSLLEEKKNTFGDGYLASPVVFTEGATKYSSSSVIVRVNPVNADLTNMINNITLIDSQGKEISNDVKVKSVQRYTGQLTSGWNSGPYTRSADQTGLWEVEFEPVENKKVDDLKNLFVKEYDLDGDGNIDNWSYITYAVSINNVGGKDTLNTSLDDARRVVSQYDVKLDYKKAVAYDADYDWSNHNKYYTITNSDNSTTIVNHYVPLTFTTQAGLRDLSDVNQRNDNDDYWWDATRTYTDGGVQKTSETPATSKIKYHATDHPLDYNVNSYKDNGRTGKKTIVAKIGERINIEFGKSWQTPIKGFFVVLDGKNAETTSAPSEINAWNSYVYENVGKVDSDAKLLTINGVNQYSTFQEGNSGYIVVKDLYGEATGDEIGFRVYAVNLNGTLVDPDGIAFYVTVGQSASDINIGANTVTVVNNATYTPAYNFDKGILAGIDQVDWTISLSRDQVVGSGNYTVEYHVNGANKWLTWGASYTEGGNTITPTPDKYDGVRFKLTGPQYFQDNATFSVSGAAKIAATSTTTEYTKFTMAGSLTKALPQTAPGFTWNEGQSEEQIVKTTGYDTNIETALRLRGVTAPLATNVSIKADLDNFAANNQKNGNLNYNDMFIQTKSGNPAINADGKFIFALANTKYNNDTKDYTDAWSTPAVGSSAPYAYNATIAASLVDCATSHALTCDYNYGKITSQKKDGAFIDYKVSATTGYNIKYMSWSYKNANYLTFTWAKGNNGQSGNNYKEWTYDVNQTLTNIQIATDRFATVYGSKLTTNLRKATLKDYIKAGWLQIVSVKTVGVESGIENPYYEWDPSTSYTDYTVLGLKKKAGVENIPAHSEKVQIKVIDCFGHQETHEFILKFTIEPVEHELTPTA
ncbi:MAG: hypothetical protein ACI3Y0_05260, partial [Prevotella sp.]